MKKSLLILLLVLLAVPAALAQTHGQKQDKDMFRELQEFKLKFIAQEIDLKEDQKEQFTKLYSEMQDKREATMRSAWEAERKVRKMKNATEADYQAAAETMSQAKEKDAQLEKEYDAKFSKFLSSKQIYKLKTAETKFRMKMDEMRHRHKNRKPKQNSKNKD